MNKNIDMNVRSGFPNRFSLLILSRRKKIEEMTRKFCYIAILYCNFLYLQEIKNYIDVNILSPTWALPTPNMYKMLVKHPEDRKDQIIHHLLVSVSNDLVKSVLYGICFAVFFSCYFQQYFSGNFLSLLYSKHPTFYFICKKFFLFLICAAPYLLMKSRVPLKTNRVFVFIPKVI